MQANPDLFDAYHSGFRAQAATWKVSPVEVALRWLRSKPKLAVIADFGCGDAQIAAELDSERTVHSYDLVSRNERVTACSMSAVPCESGALHHLAAALFQWHHV